jgi:hypothetical protein
MLLKRDVRPADSIGLKSDHPALRFAADELRRYLSRIFPADSVTPIGAGVEGAFHLGLFSDPVVRADLLDRGFTLEQLETAGSEAYVILVENDRVCLYGGRPRAVLYAVYDFLRDELGCEFAISVVGIERVPQRQELTLKPSQRLERPAFPVRGFGFHTETGVDADFYSRTIDWLGKLKFNRIQFNIRLWEVLAGALGPLLAERDLDLDLGVHSLNYFLPESVYADAHPEWYSTVKNRFGQQLRFGNLESVPVVAEAALRLIQQTPDLKYLGLWPRDGTGFEPAEIASGEMGDLVLRYVNAVTERITAAHPELVMDHLAYVGYVAPPKHTRPHPKVLTSVCHYWDQNFTQPICDAWYGKGRAASAEVRERALRNFSPSRTHAECCRDLAGWVRLGPTVVFTYYVDENLSGHMIFDLSRVIRMDMEYYRALGVRGGVTCYCMHTDYLWVFRDIHALAEFQWNPDCDWALRDARLMDAVFGSAGLGLFLFYQSLEALHNQPLLGGFRLADLFRGIPATYSLSGYNPDLHPAILRQVEERMNRAMATLDAALEAADSDVIRQRVAGIRVNLVMQRAFARLGCHVLAAFGCRDLAAAEEGPEKAELELRALEYHDEALRIFNEWAGDVKRNAPEWVDVAGKIKDYRVALEKDFRSRQL